jgi:hypothetical protein
MRLKLLTERVVNKEQLHKVSSITNKNDKDDESCIQFPQIGTKTTIV